MHPTLMNRLDRAFRLTHDLVTHLDNASLQLDLPGLPSNRIAGQMWCIIGARESYIRAMQAGAWQGFGCSLAVPLDRAAVLSALEQTHARLARLNIAQWTDDRLSLAVDLLEHEVQHHGQLIRFVYANRLSFPESWKNRYTV